MSMYGKNQHNIVIILQLQLINFFFKEKVKNQSAKAGKKNPPEVYAHSSC